MTKSNDRLHPSGAKLPLFPFPLSGAAVSLAAILAAFVLANSTLALIDKIAGFAGIVAAYISVYAILGRQASRRAINSDVEAERVRETELRLRSIEEAGECFGGVLSPTDAFRLAASRLREMLRCRTLELYIIDEASKDVVCVEVDGPASADTGLARRSFLAREILVESNPVMAAAIPLFRGMDVFGVLLIDFEADTSHEALDRSLLESIGCRLTPLVLNSMASARSQAKALNDLTTNLPNERAFHMVLESQVAESQRNRSARPLTILTLDIKDFAEINSRFGHAAGDRALAFASDLIRDCLRQMDFIAKANDDEFLAVLPTATREISHDIVARIHTAFFGRKLRINDRESLEVQLNVGWACFGTDGETPVQLLDMARVRRKQSKSMEPPKIIMFPQEYAN